MIRLRFLPKLFLPLVCLSLGAHVAPAQQPKQPEQDTPKVQPADVAALADAVRDSYYHPDALTSMSCSVSVDWPLVLKIKKSDNPDPRLAKLQMLKIRVRSIRDAKTKVTFDWTGGSLNNPDFDNGFKNAFEGFFKVYWAAFAAAPFRKTSDIVKVEALSDGGARIVVHEEYEPPSTPIDRVLTVDKDKIITHYSDQDGDLKEAVDVSHIDSPHPTPGDLRRISVLDQFVDTGKQKVHLITTLDYQEISEFFIPKHVTLHSPGNFTMKFVLTGCTVSKEQISSQE